MDKYKNRIQFIITQDDLLQKYSKRSFIPNILMIWLFSNQRI